MEQELSNLSLLFQPEDQRGHYLKREGEEVSTVNDTDQEGGVTFVDRQTARQ